ncbi:MAG: hypothetical protein WDN28_01270 [Chthoniobacter sp.]
MPQRPQPLLFHDLLLGILQLVQGVFQLRRALLDLPLEIEIVPLHAQAQEAVLDEILDAQDDLRVIEGLGEKIFCPAGQRLALRLHRYISGENQNWEIIFQGDGGLELLQDGKSVHVGHVQVQQHDVGFHFQEKGERLARIRRAAHMMATRQRQDPFQQAHVGRLIVDDEDFGIAEVIVGHGTPTLPGRNADLDVGAWDWSMCCTFPSFSPIC